jgi:hypothetical protein
MVTHKFNGTQLTMAQIRELIPCMRPDSIRKHLAEGRNTTDAILNHFPVKPKPSKASQFCIGPTPGYARTAVSNMR